MPSPPPAAIEASPRSRVVNALERALAALGPDRGRPPHLIVAFSGGPDSLALLWGLTQLHRRHELLVTAAHLDHALDPGSAVRAEQAARLAARLGAVWRCERRSVPDLRRPGEPLEAAARRVRYAFLAEVAATAGADAVLTGHHADDQAETVLLRIAGGSGWVGLAAMAERRGRLWRPLLDLPRKVLSDALSETGLSALRDPGNRDPKVLRNRLRLGVLPRLAAATPDLPARSTRLAAAAQRARRALARRFDTLLDWRPEPTGASLDLAGLRMLPPELARWALGRLHRLAAAGGAPTAAAAAELLRQLDADCGAVGCNCGGGWRWESAAGRLLLAPMRRADPRPFHYTFPVPGGVWIPETGQTLLLRAAEPADWMLHGAADRAGLALSLHPGDRVLVRTRRPGDRLRPLGAPGRRRLKEVLIDRGVPRHARDRLPLLVVDGRIAWVPGVTIDDAFRLRPSRPVWIVELQPGMQGSAATL